MNSNPQKGLDGVHGVYTRRTDLRHKIHKHVIGGLLAVLHICVHVNMVHEKIHINDTDDTVTDLFT